MYKVEWQEWGNSYYQTGTLKQVKVLWPLYILDQLLARHPHWNWWYSIWSKILPDYGDPLCFAYCFGWSNFYFKHIHELHSIKVSYDELSEEFRNDAKKWEQD